MSRKKKHAEEHENLERWLVSYADFITLLFATFVILYALSQLDLAKFKDLKLSLRKAFASESLIQGDQGILNGSSTSILEDGNDPNSSMITPLFENKEAAYEESSFNDIKKTIEKLQAEGITADIGERGLTISLVNSLFFDSGSARIRQSAFSVLNKVGSELKSKFPDHLIRVEGHSDNLPTNTSLYPSNWELSSARASSVVRFLISNYGFSSNRFAAVGYADSRPIAANSSEAGRIKNRRVEIIVLRNKVTRSESRPADFNKSRVERMKEIEQDQQKTLDKYRNVSDAAKELMRESGQSIQQVLLYKDPYAKESDKIAEEIKKKEEEKKKKLKLPDLSLEKPAGLTNEERQTIEQAKHSGVINDAVAELMKQRGDTQNVLIIKEKK